jgi:hypothetical protein
MLLKGVDTMGLVLKDVPTYLLINELNQRDDVKILHGNDVAVKTDSETLERFGSSYTVIVINDANCPIRGRG